MDILQRDNKKLREISKEVPLSDITSLNIKSLISSMKKALASQDDGVALAAPQIGVSLRIFVVSKKVFEMIKKFDHIKDDMVFINPKITKISKEKKSVEEGCLSVRYLYGQIDRATKATVRAYDENGQPFLMGGSGLLAQVFQHEIDHLDGILFIDNAKDLREIPPEEK
jgi:peptide deformylase